MILGLLYINIDHNDRESADKDTGVSLTYKSHDMMCSNEFLRDHSLQFFLITWCLCVLTHSEPVSCYVHTFWA